MTDKKSNSRNFSFAMAMQAFSKVSSVEVPSGGWTRAIRETLGLTQASLGVRIGVSRQSVQDLERAEAQRRITLDSLDRLAGAMGCRVVLAMVPQKGSLEDLCRNESSTPAVKDARPPVRARKAGVLSPTATSSTNALSAAAPALHSPQAQYAVRPAKLRIPTGRLADVCRKFQVKKLSLFGSAARNELTPESDIDLMVEFEPQARLTLFDFPALQDELSALFGGRKVDLATPDILENSYRRKSIVPDLTTLYSA
jgi:predicted DNA-binding mobile mystery protein A